MREIFKHPLFSGSAIMIVGSTIANAINYLYHLILGRLLGPSSYGELVSLISLSGLLAVLPASISLVVVKYVSASKTERDKTALISWLKIKILKFTFVFFILLVLMTPLIKSFLHINNPSYIVAVAITFLFSLPALYNRSILQGLLKFKAATISILFENGTRFITSILLVYLGYQVGGAMTGLVISVVVGWYLTKRYLKSYVWKNPKLSLDIKSMVFYTVPVLVQSVALTSLYSSDLILVKHFFSSYDAGIYAALSTLGKIILFGAGPISAVMFPIVAQRHSKGKGYRKIMILSFLATFIFAISILTVYLLFPQFAINLLYGAAYLESANLLIWFGIFITLFTLSSLIISFHLSVGRTTVVFLPALASIAQILAIWFYHGDLFTVIIISISITALLLSLLLIYSFRNWNENKKVYKLGIGNSTGI